MQKFKKIVDIVCIAALALLFFGVAVLNLMQPDRPTESAAEQRKLAQMPEFSWESLKDGSYFAGISEFISDTFIARDKLVGLSKEMDTLRGFDYSLGGEDHFVLLENMGEAGTADESEGSTEAADKLAAAIESLKNTDSASADEPDPAVPEPGTDSAPIATGEIVDEEPEAVSAEETSPTEEPTPEEPLASEEPTPDGEPEGQSEPAEPDPAADESDDTPDPEETPDVDEPEEPTEPEETAEPEEPTEPEETAEPTEPEEPVEEAPADPVTGIRLSRNTLSLTVGSGSVVYASVDSTTGESAAVRWSISDKTVASISMNPKGGIDVKAIAPGICTLTCAYEDRFKETCEITVSEVVANPVGQYAPPESGAADFLTDGMFIYGDAVFTQAWYSEAASSYYAQTAAYYKQLFGAGVNVSVVVAPVSAMVVTNPEVVAKIPDQREILNKMQALMDPSVNFVDAYTPMYEHKDEYLFFKSDHHWTQRGAYYAYTAFAESLGLTPTPLNEFTYGIRNESYSGSMYNYTYDARVKSFTDVIEAFYPTKAHTMTVTGTNGEVYNYDSSIVSVNKTYVTFIAGDNPYTVINVPSNPQDKNILVLKDSFGNAFVPFLCEHFGNIIVVDVRHAGFNIYTQLKDYGLTDIVFVNNIQAANSTSWSDMYLRAVGYQ